MTKLRLNILGAGRAARVVARWLSASKGVEISQIANSSKESARAAIAFIGSGQAVSRITGLKDGDCLLVGLPDQRLKRIGPKGLDDASHDYVDGRAELAFHLSGSLDSSILEDWACHVASIHPARAFAHPERVMDQMRGTWVTAEGDLEALSRLQSLFVESGARWQTIERVNKPLYHAATVVASNYLVTLTAMARDLARGAGFEDLESQAFLTELQSGTLANLAQVDAAQALTGPIERGDLDQVERLQRAMVAAHPDRRALLSALGLETLELAQRARGPVLEDDQMRALFTSP